MRALRGVLFPHPWMSGVGQALRTRPCRAVWEGMDGTQQDEDAEIRDMIRVRLDTQLSERQIAGPMSDSELEQALWSKDPVAANPRYAAPAERFLAIEVRLKEKGMTLERLWQEYLAGQPDGYQYSQFCLHFQRWIAGGELAMHVEHKAGAQMYVDCAGEPLVVVNAATGERWVLDVFVAILGARRGRSAVHDLLLFVVRGGTQILPVTEDDARLGVEACQRYGKGIAPARLNYGDVFARTDVMRA